MGAHGLLQHAPDGVDDDDFFPPFFRLSDFFPTFFRLSDFFGPSCPSLVPLPDPPEVLIFECTYTRPPLRRGPKRSDEVRDEVRDDVS